MWAANGGPFSFPVDLEVSWHTFHAHYRVACKALSGTHIPAFDPAMFTCAVAAQITSVLGDTVNDTIQSTAGGDGGAQFPYHAIGPDAQPPSTVKAQITQGGRRMLQS